MNTLKIWLIDDKNNSNNWSVSWDSIKRNVNSFIDKPIIYYKVCDASNNCDLQHIEDGDSYLESLASQQPYEVGTIKEIILDETNKTVYAIADIKDDKLFDIMKNDSNTKFSPSIYITNKETVILNNDKIIINDWQGIHTAIVLNPAYGSKAKIEETCEGDESTCIDKLKANDDESKPCTRNLELRISQLESQIKLKQIISKKFN